VIAIAEKLGAGVAKAFGKAALPDDLPWVTGSIGLLGTEPSYKMMSECDTLLMIGSVSLCRISAQGRSGARRADRPAAGHAQPALPDGGQSGR
jgi:thiamine pyrophosphate-dependent acetolactate synthase large subunit-like protein